MNPSFAYFELQDVVLDKYNVHYNSLPSVEESDALLKMSPRFDAFLNDAKETVTRYELESFIGLRLIHRHFLLGDSQVMAEGYELVSQAPSLVTYAHNIEDAIEVGATPSSWIFSSNPEEVRLFESSTDYAIKSARSLLEKSPDFMDEMGKVLREHALYTLISVAVLKRDALVASEDQVYFEMNYPNPAKSVVQLWDASEAIQSIRTSWSFKGPRQLKCPQRWTCYRPGGPETHQYIYRHDGYQPD